MNVHPSALIVGTVCTTTMFCNIRAHNTRRAEKTQKRKTKRAFILYMTRRQPSSTNWIEHTPNNVKSKIWKKKIWKKKTKIFTDGADNTYIHNICTHSRTLKYIHKRKTIFGLFFLLLLLFPSPTKNHCLSLYSTYSTLRIRVYYNAKKSIHTQTHKICEIIWNIFLYYIFVCDSARLKS